MHKYISKHLHIQKASGIKLDIEEAQEGYINSVFLIHLPCSFIFFSVPGHVDSLES